VLARGGEVFTAAATRQDVRTAIEYSVAAVAVGPEGLGGGRRVAGDRGQGVLYKILGQSGGTLI